MNNLICFTLIGILLTTASRAAEPADPVEEGNQLWSEGKLQQAETRFRKAIEHEPDSALPHARLAGLLLSQHRNAEARKEYQYAIMKDPENPQLFLALAIVYLHEKSYSNAQAMLNVAMELAPEKENVHKLQEYLTLRMGNPGGVHAESTGSSKTMPRDTVHSDTTSDKATIHP